MTEMAMHYTYQLGERMPLTFSPDQFVSRATSQRLMRNSFRPLRQLSPHSFLVESPASQLTTRVRRAQQLGAPAFLDYRRNDTGRRVGVTDRFFVRFRRQMRPSDARNFGATKRLDLMTSFDNRNYLYRLNKAHVDPVSVVVDVTERDHRAVEMIDHDANQWARLCAHTGLDPGCEHQWYLKAIGGLSSVGAEAAWDKLGNRGSRDVVIGMIDAGFDVLNPEFSREKFAGWAYLLDGNLVRRREFATEAVYRMASDTPHGTKCAIAAVAEINGVGGAGVAPDCRLLPVNCEHRDGTIDMCPSKFVRVVEAIADEVDVISCSWDLGPDQVWPDAVREFVERMIESGGRRKKGVVFVWAAGNDNRPIHYEANVDVPFTSEIVNGAVEVRATRRFRNQLVEIPGVIQVGAISSELQRCHYSNYGPGLTLAAPASNRHAYDAEHVVVNGKEFVIPDFAPDFIGTSASAAMVSGVAALVISANPSLTAREVVSILKSTADKDLKFEGYPRYRRKGADVDEPWDVSPIAPFDRGEFRDAGDREGSWSPWFGYGKVNASRAVEAAMQRRAN